MRLISLIFAIQCLHTLAFGQVYFSKVYNFGLPNVVFTNVAVEKDSILIIAVINDTIDPIANSIIITSDLEGNIAQINRFKHNFGWFDAWRRNLNILNDSTYVLGVEAYFPYTQAGLIFFNKQGEIIKSKYIINPLYPEEDFMVSNDIVILSENKIIYSYKENTNHNSSDINVKLLDNDLIVTDSLKISLNFHGNLFAIESTLDHNLIFGMHHVQTVEKGFTFQNIIQKRDTNLNLIWEYKTKPDSLYSSLFSIEATRDSGFIAATYTGKEYYVNPNSNDYCMDDVYVYKLDKNGKLLWETRLDDYSCSGNVKSIKKIDELESGNILIAGAGGTDGKFHGLVAKLSSTGDSLWQRYYRHPDKPETLFHNFNDMTVLDNGDIILCGESGGPQEGWLMRVDSMGCLIPGCITAIESITSDHSFEMMIAPNPIHDQLILHLAVDNRFKDGTCSLVNMQGQVVKSWVNTLTEVTHIVDVEDIPSGHYKLVYQSQGQYIESKGVVKE